MRAAADVKTERHQTPKILFCSFFFFFFNCKQPSSKLLETITLKNHGFVWDAIFNFIWMCRNGHLTNFSWKIRWLFVDIYSMHLSAKKGDKVHSKMQNSKNVGKQGRDNSIKQFSIQSPYIRLYEYACASLPRACAQTMCARVICGCRWGARGTYYTFVGLGEAVWC